MARLALLTSPIFLCLLVFPLTYCCQTEEDCAQFMATKRSDIEPKRAVDSVKSRIGASARFWGKRSEAAADDVKMKIAKSRLFWGKRSSENAEQFPVDDDVDYSQEPYFRSIKASLPSKLTLSSRFWGRR
ncbi:hypothetical protein PRIPAC_97055 [Pristionchus pacificus]|uniref:Uncharacterized protein n=1 Tax=Pristionchus pacificus TaxID=54126 RepID=A0A2A6CUS1_PRIPA|nr:hypothetical protein PRIPAC_97055 [Pristionchus pacificus]|eukprot:PDM81797.1 hypothetical protein PRIPAC_33951 [Pristionchus pacificus]